MGSVQSFWVKTYGRIATWNLQLSTCESHFILLCPTQPFLLEHLQVASDQPNEYIDDALASDCRRQDSFVNLCRTDIVVCWHPVGDLQGTDE